MCAHLLSNEYPVVNDERDKYHFLRKTTQYKLILAKLMRKCKIEIKRLTATSFKSTATKRGLLRKDLINAMREEESRTNLINESEVDTPVTAYSPLKSELKFRGEVQSRENTISDLNTPPLEWVTVNTPETRLQTRGADRGNLEIKQQKTNEEVGEEEE